MTGLYPNDASILDSIGRLLIVLGFMVAVVRNLNAYQIGDHIKRLEATNAPFPAFAFWFGTASEVVGCAMLAFNWHPGAGALILLLFTIAATGLLLRYWEVPEQPKRSGMQNGFNANIVVCGGLLLLMARLPW